MGNKELERSKLIQIASVVSVLGNTVLAVSKIIFGILSGSLSVLGDGLDSLTDVFISLITLAISIIITRPPNKEYPYGYYRSETIATIVLSFVMFFIGGQLVISTIEKVIYHDYEKLPEWLAVYVTIFSIIGKLLLSFSQFYLGKKSESTMIIANGKNMLNDIFTSSGVLVGLGFTYFFKMPVIDRVIAILIGIWIMISSLKIFKSTLREIMDGEKNMELYQKVFKEVEKIKVFSNPHRLRIRKLGVYFLIEFDVEMDGEIKIKDAHEYVKNLEKNIRSAIPYIYDIFIHVEPEGDIDHYESWGLRQSDLA